LCVIKFKQQTALSVSPEGSVRYQDVHMEDLFFHSCEKVRPH